jgi:hypothetical protein
MENKVVRNLPPSIITTKAGTQFILTLSLWFFGVCPRLTEFGKGRVLDKVPPVAAS